MSDPINRALDRLSRVAGIRGVLIVDAQAGVPVVAELAEGVEDAAVAALTASLFRRMERAADTAVFGALAALHLEAEAGHVFVASAGDTLVVAVADRDAQLGLVRLETERAAEDLK